MTFEEKIVFLASDGRKIAGLLTAPAESKSRAVILLHCFTCTKHHRILRTLSEAIIAKGIAVLRFDFGGNGESEGKLEDETYTRMIGEVGSAIDFMTSRGYTQLSLAGHSMGAMMSVLSAYELKETKAKSIISVVFIAGSSQAARVRDVFPAEIIRKAETEGSAQAFVYGREIILKKEFLMNVEQYNLGLAVAMLKRPILIVHGDEDELIPVFHARQLYNWAGKPKELKIIHGADHLFRDSKLLEKMTMEVAEWLDKLSKV